MSKETRSSLWMKTQKSSGLFLGAFGETNPVLNSLLRGFPICNIPSGIWFLNPFLNCFQISHPSLAPGKRISWWKEAVLKEYQGCPGLPHSFGWSGADKIRRNRTVLRYSSREICAFLTEHCSSFSHLVLPTASSEMHLSIRWVPTHLLLSELCGLWQNWDTLAHCFRACCIPTYLLNKSFVTQWQA